MSSTNPKPGSFYTPPPGHHTTLAMLRVINLCDKQGEPTGATITIRTDDALGTPIRAAERLGAIVVGIYFDPADASVKPLVFVAEPAEWPSGDYDISRNRDRTYTISSKCQKTS